MPRPRIPQRLVIASKKKKLSEEEIRKRPTLELDGEDYHLWPYHLVHNNDLELTADISDRCQNGGPDGITAEFIRNTVFPAMHIAFIERIPDELLEETPFDEITKALEWIASHWQAEAVARK